MSRERATKDVLGRSSTPKQVDWHSLRGALKSSKTNSVKLQHAIWSKVD